MTSLCYQPGFTSTKGDSPAALGNRIAAAVIKAGLSDGSLEQQHYADPSYTVRERAAGRRAAGHDDARPDLLAAARARPDRLPERHRRSRPRAVVHRRAVGSRARASRCPPPRRACRSTRASRRSATPETDAYKQAAVEVIRASASSTRTTGRRSTSAPARAATTRSGRTAATATSVNPVTGKPYAPNLVRRADFARIVTEFWADGPELRDAARALERARQRRLRLAAARVAHRARRRGPAEVGRAALLRPQRRRARRGDRRVGDQARTTTACARSR